MTYSMNENRKYFPYAVVFGAFLVHFALIFLPSVNLEFAFADAASYFENQDRALIDQYFTYQANTLGIPWLASSVKNFFPAMDSIIAVRLLSISGVALLAAGFLRISRYLEDQDNLGALAILLLNPLVWTYSGRGTADLLPAAVGVFAISLALSERINLLRIISAGIILGVAAVLKYHEIFLSLFLFAMLWSKHRDRRAWINSAAVTAVAITILGLYLVTAHRLFGFWITPEHFQKEHGLNLGNFISNFIAYAGYLVLLTAPFSLFFPGARRLLRQQWKLLLPVAVILFLWGAYGITDNGEMNLGPLDRWVPKPVVTGTFLMLSLACLIPLVIGASEKPSIDTQRKALAIAVLVLLAIFSVSRPAQRYLLPVLPFFLLALPRSAFQIRLLVPVMIFAFVMVNAFIGYSQWCTGTAAERMAQAIEREGYIAVTGPGAIEAHVGNRFREVDRSNIRFVVVTGVASGAVITVENGFSFARKSFSLVSANEGVQR